MSAVEPLLQRTIAVIGLGYVGLPVAVAFARRGFNVIGFDISTHRVTELREGRDATGEVAPDDLRAASIRFTEDEEELRLATIYIVTVPTPIDQARRPDLSALKAASRSVGKALKPGDLVVYESTVYPGATEEDCIPILEGQSGLAAGTDFAVSYSPERINPGDPAHRFETIAKVVSGQDAAALGMVAELYGAVVSAPIHRASSIRVAEAAKVIENAQRDINIAFMNELSEIFGLLGIDTSDVLAAAATKWNFLPFTPGLVGGHCIGVDPYYLTHRAEREGYHPRIILAGRELNDGVGARIARQCVKMLLKDGGGRSVTLLGATFKENVPDTRNTRVVDIVRELTAFGLSVQISDPVADPAHFAQEYGMPLTPLGALEPADAVVLCVPHREYLAQGWSLVTPLLKAGRGIVIDVKARLPRDKRPDGVALWRM